MAGLFPRVPNKVNRDDPDCDNELPAIALRYRKQEGLLTETAFRKYNITVWKLTVDGKPVEPIVKENVPISVLRERFGPAVDRRAEVGFHAEMQARDALEKRPEFAEERIRVEAIFTERMPCREMCRPMLKEKHRWTPTYAYITDHSTLDGQATEKALMMAYGVWNGGSASR